MKAKFSVSTDLVGSCVSEVVDINELTGYDDQQLSDMSPIDIDDLISSEYQDWLQNNANMEWRILDQ